MGKYILKEYGSWGVMIISYLTGLFAGGRVGLNGISGFIAVSLYINSKQALTLGLRSSRTEASRHLTVFIMQVVIASVIIVPVIRTVIVSFLPYLVLPVIYLVLLRFAGEHSLATEVSGFTLLTMPSLIAKFTVTGNIDLKLYIAVTIFFIAGVLKVRVQFKKSMFTRVLMVVYVIFAIAVYHLIRVPLIAISPLADNLIFAATLYRIKLRTAGRLELIKGFLFLAMISQFY